MVNKVQLPLQKLLFSATMTHNPEKLAPLKLYKPVLFTAVGRLEGKEESSDSRGEKIKIILLSSLIRVFFLYIAMISTSLNVFLRCCNFFVLDLNFTIFLQICCR